MNRRQMTYFPSYHANLFVRIDLRIFGVYISVQRVLLVSGKKVYSILCTELTLVMMSKHSQRLRFPETLYGRSRCYVVK